MRTYTISTKHIICPVWNIEVALSGKYFFKDVPGEEHIGHFAGSSCPIVENSRLPEHKQDKELSWYPSCKNYPCEYLNHFKDTIDVRDGYLQ